MPDAGIRNVLTGAACCAAGAGKLPFRRECALSCTPVNSRFATATGNAIMGAWVLMAADDAPRCPDLPPRTTSPRRRLSPPARKIVIGAGLGGYSWFAAGTVPFTRNALLIVLLPGAVLGVIAHARPPRRIPPPDRLDVTGFSYWAIAVAALLEWEAAAFRDDSRWWHPSLTGLIDPALGARPVKAAGILIWLLAGWGLVRR